MRLKEMIDTEYNTYKKVEDEVRAWVENKWAGLTIEVGKMTLEIVRTGFIDYTPEAALKITEEVNAKINELLDRDKEQIYFASLMERIWQKHPNFNPEVESLEELKNRPRFLKYLRQLHA